MCVSECLWLDVQSEVMVTVGLMMMFVALLVSKDVFGQTQKFLDFVKY